MIAGFDMPTSGQVLLNGKDIAHLPPHKRPLNTVFQRYALFQHLDVYDNIAYGLKTKKIEYKVVNKKGEEVVKKPNSGKTTMYNAITGRNEKVGNWAGVTVEKKEHPIKKAFYSYRSYRV